MLAMVFDSMAVSWSNSVLPYDRTEGHRQGEWASLFKTGLGELTAKWIL